MSGLILTRDDDLSPDALGLIAQSEAELASIYPPEVRYAFSPSELRDAGVTRISIGGSLARATFGLIQRAARDALRSIEDKLA